MKIENMWKNLEESTGPNETLMKIYRSVVFENTFSLGDIKEQFNEWSLREIKMALEALYFYGVMESDDYEDDTDGERHCFYDHPYREAAMSYHFESIIWNKAKPKGKKFF
jgi:hypothetical protein